MDNQCHGMTTTSTVPFSEGSNKLLDMSIEDKTVIDSIANDAFSDLSKIKGHIDSCEKRAKESLDKAAEAVNKPVGFWHSTTPALIALQVAAESLGKSQVDISETQKLLFEQQQTTATAISRLFKLSVYSIATTRVAVKEIQMRLANASEEEISAVARKELENVVMQLKRQLDIMEQQERLAKQVSEIKSQMDECKQSIEKKLELLSTLEQKVVAKAEAFEKSEKERINSFVQSCTRKLQAEIGADHSKKISTLFRINVALIIMLLFLGVSVAFLIVKIW